MTITFKDLHLNPKILKALETCGYSKPTPVQARSIPEILAGNDLVASAQTGTGKTAAFVLPALELLSTQEAKKKPRVLILTPTRELAAQITKAASQYGKFLNFNIVSLVGGMGYVQQVKQLTRAVDIIVATPGRLLDHMDSRRVDLSQVEMLVLDEADRMLDMGFIDDVREIAKATSADKQTLLFSATMNQQLNNVIKQLLQDPVKIDFAHEAISPDRIQQVLYLADNAQHKTEIVEHLLQNENIFKAIIFTATKKGADELAQALRADGFAAAALHGDLKQAARNRTVEQLRRGKVQYVIATDVAARGIDISDLTHVINYDLPRFSEDYVHRIGRTGRAGKTGIAISICLPSEIRHLQKIERYIDQALEQAVIPGLEPRKNTKTSAAPKRDGKKSAHRGRGGKPERDNHQRGAKKEGGRDKFKRTDKFTAERRADKPKHTERSEKRSDRFATERTSEKPRRDDRADRFSAERKSDKPRRDDRADRFSAERKSDKPRRDDRTDRFSAERKSDKPRRADRTDRFSAEHKSDKPRRGDRAERFARTEKPQAAQSKKNRVPKKPGKKY